MYEAATRPGLKLLSTDVLGAGRPVAILFVSEGSLIFSV